MTYYKLLPLSLIVTISCMLKCFSLAYFRRIKSTSKLFNTVHSTKNNTIKNVSSSFINSHDTSQLSSSHGNDKYYTNSLEFYHVLRNCRDGYISQHINHALDILTDAYRLYGPDHLISSYNGGKDADVIMHLLRAVSAKYAEDHKTAKSNSSNDSINNNNNSNKGSHISKLVYFAIDDEFDEVIRHINFTKQLYHLDIVQYDCGIVQGLKMHVDNMNKINNKFNNNDNGGSSSTRNIPGPAFILGTRMGDPNCGDQQSFTPSSAWMPVAFMRVNPILNW